MESSSFCVKFQVVPAGVTSRSTRACVTSGANFQRYYPHRLSCCQDGGNFIKASYSAAKPPSQNPESVPHKLLLESFRISGRFPTFPSTTLSLLDASDDEYEGVIVDSDNLPRDAQDFGFMLRASLANWRSKGKKGVWLKLPLDRADLVPIAVKEGFKYHHAEEDYVMLTYWIPQGPSLLPANASHQVGVGGLVINDKDEVLVVQEKYCASSCAGNWKVPTGFINESEEIYDGVVREVEEETGIVTEFVEVIAFRHAHCVAFKKSDLFFVCLLKPLSTEIQIDGVEIQAARWMPLAEFIQQPFVRSDNMFQKIIDICIARLRKRYCGLAAHPVISKFDGKSSILYYNVSEAEDIKCLGEA